MEPIHLAFLWHQHQPFYKDPLRQHYVLPWVRLHAIRDYVGMLLVLREFPEMRATVNLAPSLVAQLEDYAAGTAEDISLHLTRKPAEELDETDRLYILDQFFSGNAPKVICVFPRYHELLAKRRRDTHAPGQALGWFNAQELRDLQVWATLAWFHPLVVHGDEVLRELRAKGRDFTEADKAAMLERQDMVLRTVLPLHRRMADKGQVELSTTPYYHPILPLLCNLESAREGLPGLPMPDKVSDFRPDAEVHVARALELHERVFGRPPRGMWPAEGSVGMDMLPLLRGRGLRWIASDEGILHRSIGTDLSRDHSSSLCHPDGLYQPYGLPGDDLPAIVFRDRSMSDAIGFEYHRGDIHWAAENLTWRIAEAARRCSGRPRLVTIILDGENPWDYYDDAGLPFLRELYSHLLREPLIRPTRLCDYLAEHPPAQTLPRLHAGSWIDANFGVWIGTPEDRAAWSLTAETREALLRREARKPALNAKKRAKAWEEIYIAEGSDWCWWLGGDRTSEQDYLFDALFRSHLASVYTLIGEPVPDSLHVPLGKPARHAPHAQPQGLIEPEIDGHTSSYYEWTPAGRFSATRPGGAMRPGVSDPVSELYYGFGRESFFVRLDPPEGELQRAAGDLEVRVTFLKPARIVMQSGPLSAAGARLRMLEPAQAKDGLVGTVCVERLFEAAVPRTLLAAAPDDSVEFVVELLRAGTPIQRIPEAGSIAVTAPAS